MITLPASSYPGVEAEQTDASRVHDISYGVAAGAVQVLLKFSELDELSARQVVFESGPAHKVVLVAVPLVYPCSSGRICVETKPPPPPPARLPWRMSDRTVGALRLRTYVEQRWQTFRARWTGASDAAHRVRCLSARSGRRGVSGWSAGGRATSLRTSAHPRSLQSQKGGGLLLRSSAFFDNFKVTRDGVCVPTSVKHSHGRALQAI